MGKSFGCAVMLALGAGNQFVNFENVFDILITVLSHFVSQRSFFFDGVSKSYTAIRKCFCFLYVQYTTAHENCQTSVPGAPVFKYNGGPPFFIESSCKFTSVPL